MRDLSNNVLQTHFFAKNGKRKNIEYLEDMLIRNGLEVQPLRRVTTDDYHLGVREESTGAEALLFTRHARIVPFNEGKLTELIKTEYPKFIGTASIGSGPEFIEKFYAPGSLPMVLIYGGGTGILTLGTIVAKNLFVAGLSAVATGAFIVSSVYGYYSLSNKYWNNQYWRGEEARNLKKLKETINIYLPENNKHSALDWQSVG